MMSKVNYVRVNKLTSVIGGPVNKGYVIKDGGVISASTSPGCWGPMITPELFSGHEVTEPVYLEDAMPGDAVAIVVNKIEILSDAAASGTGKTYPGRFDGDPSVYAKCPHCNIHNPKTYIDGIGEDAIRCEKCGNSIIPQTFDNGYTVVISKEDQLAVAVNQEIAEEVARRTSKNEYFKPEDSRQHLATILGRADFSDLLIRPHPMIGNIGCSPASKIPASKNTGDFMHTIKNTPLFQQPSLDEINDAHMDISHIGEGCIVISPVVLGVLSSVVLFAVSHPAKNNIRHKISNNFFISISSHCLAFL
jgi:formamidase